MSWETEYPKKLQTADEALEFLKSGMRGYIHPGCAQPETLVESRMQRAPELRDVQIIHMRAMGPAPYCDPKMAGHFRHSAFFIGPIVRDAIDEGSGDYIPIDLSAVEELFESGAMPLDLALIQVSPPDSHGFCSFGVGVDTTLTAAKCARYVIAQVNSYMPRTYGDSYIHVSDVNAVVESSRPPCEFKQPVVTDMLVSIARNVAGLIEDGAVLQNGIGAFLMQCCPSL